MPAPSEQYVVRATFDDAAALEVRRDLETFREVFLGKQSRGEVPGDETLLADLDRLTAARC